MSKYYDKSVIRFKELLRIFRLIDCWVFKKASSNENGFTYYDKKSKSYSRLDYVLVSENFCGELKSVIIRQPVRGNNVIDHKAVRVSLSLKNQTRGPGYWKLNNNILKEKNYQKGIKQVIRETKSKHSSTLDNALLWELLKLKIKECSISYSIEKSLKEKTEVALLQNRLDSLNDEIVKYKNDEDKKLNLEFQRDNIQAKLVNHFENKAKGCYVRSRAKFINEGATNSKLFLGLEQQRQGNNVIRKIQTEHGHVSSNNEILTKIFNFYKALYQSRGPSKENISKYLKGIQFPQISNRHRELCENPFSEAEASDAVQNLKLNKSPGLDGLTPEFYQTFWEELKYPYLDMITESLRQGSLPCSMRQAVVTLIFKKGDNTDLKNYRPISLSNYDYKILSFMLASYGPNS